MDHLWRLLSAIFLIAASVGLFVMGWIFSSGRFDDYFTVILLYISLAGIAWGISRGVWVMLEHHYRNDQKDE